MAIPAYDVTRDRFPSTVQASWPARNAAAIAPSDTVAVAIGPSGVYARALYVGVAGDLTVVMADDRGTPATPVTFTAAQIGWQPIQVRMVMATGTTATNIVGLGD